MSDTKKLIRVFHTICTVNGITREQKELIYESYNVTSSTQLSRVDLEAVIAKIGFDANVWRRRVIAAISETVEKQEFAGSYEKIAYIKTIACRAAKCDDFNKIKIPKLRALYNQFCTKKSKS